MSRPIRRETDLGLSAIAIEGGLISPEQLAAIANTPPDQKAADDYGCPRGVSLRDEITRYFRIGQAHWQDYARLEQSTPAQTVAFVRKLLTNVFGFDDLKGPITHQAEGHTYRIALEARDGRIPIVVAAPLADLKTDAFNKAQPEMGDDPGGSIARRSPATLLQSWLNAEPDYLWGLVFAGDRVRLMRDNASFTRAAHIEADLGSIFRDEMFADFTALWFLIHASRFGAAGAGPTECALERWREAGQKSGTAARERLRGNVEEALLALGQGLLADNPELAQRMAADTAVLTSVYQQMLRVVYRLIFLAVGEARDLLHLPAATSSTRSLYAGSYGFSHMRERAARRSAHDHHHDAWEGARIVFRALERGDKTLGLPGLGGLFASGKTQDLDQAHLSNRAFLTAVFRLSWLTEDGRRVRINWRDMATEELGSVYEGLLELVPQIIEDGRRFDFAGGDEARGNARKISGSYYTPDPLVQALLDSALNPVLEQAEREGGAEAILKLNIIDPACGSGHFLLGAARRMATRVAQLRNPDAPDYQAAMRDVVRLCVHGVDRNPMAVELAKVALWIEAVDPGKPLGFLDGNIRPGDSLLGVFDLKALEEGVPDAAYRPLTGDDKEAARTAGKVNRQQRENRAQGDLIAGLGGAELARIAERVHAMPEDSLVDMNAKAEAFTKFRAGQGWGALKLACDLYVAAFLRKKQFRSDFATAKRLDRVPTTLDVRTAFSGRQPDPQITALAVDIAEEARAFHWPVEFPDVFARGGFDLVIGNPPWEVMQLSEEEYFAQREPEIAALSGAARKRAISALEREKPDVFSRFENDKRQFEALNEFARSSGRFDLTARGKINTYGLFAEHFAKLVGPTGRSGIIVPTGIATDATTAPFFAHLIENRRLASLIDFENSAPIFSDVHRSFKFCLLTLGSDIPEAAFSFFLTDIVEMADEDRCFSLTSRQIALINPNTRTAPVFRSREDARLTTKIYERVPILVDENLEANGNRWGISFRQGLFNMTSDSGRFRTAAQLNSQGFQLEGMEWVSGSVRYVPLYESKMLDQYNHRYADYALRGDERGHRVLPALGEERLSDPDDEAIPYYWILSADVEEELPAGTKWLIGYGEATTATTYRTFVATAFPAWGVGHKSVLIFTNKNKLLEAEILANFNSIVLDYVTRTKVSYLTLGQFIVKQLPILDPNVLTDMDLNFIIPRVLELSYTSHSMAPFARDLGYEGPPFKWNESRRAKLQAELDAWYARAYGLTREELRYILDPADIKGPDYPSETFRVLKEKEIKTYGEYRSQRLILAAWDEQEVVVPQPTGVDPGALPDEAWALPVAVALIDVVQLQIAASLGALLGPTSETDVRLAALYAIEPRLLTAQLTGERQRQWRRLVGSAADPLPGSISAVAPRVSTVWGQSVGQLRAAGALIHTEADMTWSSGPGLSRYVIPAWADGRARFILSMLAELKNNNVVAVLPSEDQDWIAGRAAA